MRQILSDAIEAIEELLKNSTHVYKCKANHGTIVDGGGERRNWKDEYCNCHMKKGKSVLSLLIRVRDGM